MATIVLGVGKCSPGIPDQEDFKWGPGGLPKGKRRADDRFADGENADGGRFKGKAIFVLSAALWSVCQPLATRQQTVEGERWRRRIDYTAEPRR